MAYDSNDILKKGLTSEPKSAIVDKSSQETDTGQSDSLKPGVGSGESLPPISGMVVDPSDPRAAAKAITELEKQVDTLTTDPLQVKLNQLQRAKDEQFRQETESLKEMTKAALAANKWGEVGEQIAHAVAQFAAAQYGLKHGVDMSGLKFTKADWKAYQDEALQNHKTILEDIGSRRALAQRDIIDQRSIASQANRLESRPDKTEDTGTWHSDSKRIRDAKGEVMIQPGSRNSKSNVFRAEGVPYYPGEDKPERPMAEKPRPVTDLTSKINNVNRDIDKATAATTKNADPDQVEAAALGILGEERVKNADKNTWTRGGMTEELKKALGVKLQQLRQRREDIEEEIRKRQQGLPQAEQPTTNEESSLVKRVGPDGKEWLFDAVTKKAVRLVQ